MTGRTLTRERVYDPVLRLIHAWNLIVVFTLIPTGLAGLWIAPGPSASRLHDIHVLAGEALILGLVARLVWGLNGPTHARLTELWRPDSWVEALRLRRFFTAPDKPGHHGPATAGYVATYILLLGLAFSGLSLIAIKHGTGPFAGWLGYDMSLKAGFMLAHECLAYGVMIFVALHLLALIGHQRIHGLPVARSMIDGYQHLPEKQ